LESGTGVPGATLRGVHLRLPGRGHIAFEVPSVPAARRDVLRAGGTAVGEIVALTTAAGARVTWCYVTDPEGNIIELQAWS
jgi:catechol 2,3-dioxygenase-like lactoylglutathione lyase family enzyme